MANLFIIGNGFDSAHRLPTAYKHFNEFLKKQYPESNETAIEIPTESTYDDGYSEYDVIDSVSFLRTILTNTEGEDWVDLESALGRLDFSEYIKTWELDDDDIDGYEVEDFNSGVSHNMIEPILSIKEYFPEWINSIEIEHYIAPFKDFKRRLKKKHYILNFNYTNTLEWVYGEKNVFHIHGCQGKEIIFGHGALLKQPSDFEVEYPGAESALCEIHAGLKKNTSAVLAKADTINFINNLRNIDVVYSYGFSYGDVDMPYFEAIFNKIPTKNVIWLFNDYASPEKIELYKKKLIAYGFEGKFGTFHVYENKEWFKRIINRIKL